MALACCLQEGCRRRTLSQKTVAFFLGLLITDEGFRRRFKANPFDALMAMDVLGYPLTPIEREVLGALDIEGFERVGQRLDPRIRKLSLTTGLTPG